MQIRFVQEWRHHKIGSVVDFPGGLADVLVRIRKVAVYPGTAPAGRPPEARETADFDPRRKGAKRT
jgi:hypothetical protein